MLRLGSLLAILLILVLAPLHALAQTPKPKPGPAADLRYRPTKGDTAKYRLKNDFKGTARLMSSFFPTSSTCTIELTTKVLDTHPDKARVQATLTAIKASASLADRSASFDSAAPKDADKGNALAPMARAMLAKPLVFTINAKGVITDIEGLPEPPSKAKPDAKDPQKDAPKEGKKEERKDELADFWEVAFTHMSTRERAIDTFSHLFTPGRDAPDHAGVGDTWSLATYLGDPVPNVGRLTVIYIYALNAVEPNRATIAISGSPQIEPDPKALVTLRLVSPYTDAALKWDTKLGLLESLDQTTIAGMAWEYEGVTLSVILNLSTKIERLSAPTR